MTTIMQPEAAGRVRLTPRPYQAEAIERVLARQAAGARRLLGVAATGLGKTVIFSLLAERLGGRALILAHRDELISQAAAKVREVWPGVDVGIVKAGQNDVTAQVVVASVQTLARRARLDALAAPIEGRGLLHRADPFTLVVVDEAHHAAADTYRGVLDRLRAGDPGCTCGRDHERLATPEEVEAGFELGVMVEPCPLTAPGPLLLGVTATPDRGDGKGLDDLFDEVAFSYDILWGIRAGYLADLTGVRVELDRFDLDAVRVRQGDYDQGQAGRAMEEAGADRFIARAWKEHAAGRKTLVFTPTVALAEKVAAEFAHEGVRAAHLSGATPLEERRRLLAAFSRGDVDVIANCAVLTEGYDEPGVSCVIVARPTKSRALYTQMVGRGSRRHPDKDLCVVLDVVGASKQHTLVTIPSLFGIDAPEQVHRDGMTVCEAVTAQEVEQVRLGRIRAEDAELFAKVRAQGIAWSTIHRPGDDRRRYERNLGKDQDGRPQPTVVLAQRVPGDDVWTAGLLFPDGAKRVLIADVPLELAQGVGEDYARKAGASKLIEADAEWRKRRPTPKQRKAAAKWRLKLDPAWTAGELSEALDAHIARIREGKRRQPRGA